MPHIRPLNPNPSHLLRRRITARVWDQLRRRPVLQVELYEHGIRVYEPHGEVYEVPTEKIGHLQILDHRDLILGFGHPQHALVKIPMSRLAAGDRFDQLRERLEASAHPYSVAEGPVLEHSEAATLDRVFPPRGETLDGTWGDSRGPSGDGRVRVGENEFVFTTTPYSVAASQSFCRQTDEAGAVDVFRVFGGRVLSPHGVVLGWFEPLRNSLFRKWQENQPTGFYLQTIGGNKVSYDAIRRTFAVDGVAGALTADPDGLNLRFEQPVDQRIALVALALTKFVRVDRSRSPTLHLPDAAPPVQDFRESRFALIRFAPLVFFILVVVRDWEFIPFVLLLLAIQYGAIYLAVRIFGDPQSIKPNAKQCWNVQRALHVTEHSTTFCMGFGFHHPAILPHAIGHVHTGRHSVTITAGWRGNALNRTRLFLPADQSLALVQSLQNRAPQSLFSLQSSKEGHQISPWTWASLLPGETEITSAQVMSARTLLRQVVLTPHRSFEIVNGSRTTLVEINDSIGRAPLFHLSNTVLSWHSGARLAEIHAVRRQSARLSTPDGMTLAVSDQGITLDDTTIGSYQYQDAGRAFAYEKPTLEVIVALVAGLCARFDIYPTPPPRSAAR